VRQFGETLDRESNRRFRSSIVNSSVMVSYSLAIPGFVAENMA
jgi:hypothetical protein